MAGLGDDDDDVDGGGDDAQIFLYCVVLLSPCRQILG